MGRTLGRTIMKRISLLVLTFISFLFVGMMMPNVYAAAPSGDYYVTVSVLTTEDVSWTEAGRYSSGALSYGSTFSIDASTISIANMEFSFWLVNGVITSYPANTSFIVSTELEIIAGFKPVGELVVLYVDSNNQLVDVEYVEMNSSTTTLLDGNSLTKPGMVFAGWDQAQANISEDTVIKALYDLDPLTAQVTIDISENTGLGAGTFDYNDVVTVTADILGFTHWTENGEVVSYDPTYTFTAIKNRTLKAETGGTEVPVVFLQDVTGIRAQHESYLGQVYLPEGYTLIETGLLVSDTVPIPTYGVAGVDAIVSSSINTTTNEFLRTISDDDAFRFVRGYAIVDSGSNIEVLYSTNAKHSVMLHFHLNTPESWINDQTVYLRGSFNNWSNDHLAIVQEDWKWNYHVSHELVWFGNYIN